VVIPTIVTHTETIDETMQCVKEIDRPTGVPLPKNPFNMANLKPEDFIQLGLDVANLTPQGQALGAAAKIVGKVGQVASVAEKVVGDVHKVQGMVEDVKKQADGFVDKAAGAVVGKFAEGVSGPLDHALEGAAAAKKGAEEIGDMAGAPQRVLRGVLPPVGGHGREEERKMPVKPGEPKRSGPERRDEPKKEEPKKTETKRH
jgi:hypothetical protein